MEDTRIKFVWKDNFPLNEFFPAPKYMMKQGKKIFIEDTLDHAVYLSEIPVSHLLDVDLSDEMCTPLIDAYYLTDRGHFVGYYFKPKARNVVLTNTHFVVSTNSYMKSMRIDLSPKSDLQYTTEHLSAFYSESGSCMLLRQFNSKEFINSLES